MSLAMHEPASVLTLQLFAIGQNLHCLGRQLRQMKVTVDPGLKNTLNMVRDCTSEMVLHTMMLSGVSLFLFGIVTATLFDLSSASELSPNTGKASASKVGLPVGNVLALFLNKDLSKGIAFPAVKVSR